MELGNMDRLLEELLTSIADSAELELLDMGSVADDLSPTLNIVDIHKLDVEPAAESTDNNKNYRQRLRSYSSFPASTNCSDTSTSQLAEVMDVTYASDGAGSDHRKRIRRHVRNKRTGGNKNRTDGELSTYDCNVCGQTFLSPQSLGGHKNLHKGKSGGKLGGKSGGKSNSKLSNLGSCCRVNCRAVTIPTDGSQSSESTSTSTEGTVPSPIFKGVRCREGTKWVSEIRPPKSADKWWLGTFGSAEEAAQAYDVALCYFKSETDLNFDLHALCRELPPIEPPDLSPNEFAQRLRKMVKDISEQIIADRRRWHLVVAGTVVEEEPALTAASSEPTASGDSSSTAIMLGPPTLPDFDPNIFLVCNDLTF